MTKRDATTTPDLRQIIAALTLLSLFSPLAGSAAASLPARQPAPDAHTAPAPEARENALPLPIDRGAAALEQCLKRLGTWASIMAIVAHPDDEDGAMLTYESRGQGVRSSLLTLTRGEGGQNAISADVYDALGLIRTNELLKAGQYYGVKQYWGTEADFGFSKTQEESFARWGHERVLYDAVLAIRRERPLVLTATFVGGVTDGHGQHQVSGEIAQEAFVAAGDPAVFPDQVAAGLRPWTPLKVYALTPFAPVTAKGMFDYATGKWAPVRFFNYVSKESSTTAPATNVSIPEGDLDPVLGLSYVQIARQGWGEQKSQNGGANPVLSGSDSSGYHRYGSRIKPAKSAEDSFFDGIPTSIPGLASLLSDPAPDWLKSGLAAIASDVLTAQKTYIPTRPESIAPALKAGNLAAQALRNRVESSQFKPNEKADLQAELDIKINQFQTALAQALGLDLQAFTVRGGPQPTGRFGPGIEQSPQAVTPGEPIQVKIHTSHAAPDVKLSRVWLQSADGKPWAKEPKAPGNAASDADQTLPAQVPSDAAPTQPYFSRPGIEQPFYDVSEPALRGLSLAPYPLSAWAEFSYDGLPIRMGEVVQALQRSLGPGGYFVPVVVTPPVGVSLDPTARVLPLDGSPLPVRVKVHTEGAADGKVRLKLPPGWTATPAELPLHRTETGDSEPMLFEVSQPALSGKTVANNAEFKIEATVESAGKQYTEGWQTVAYPGLRPCNLYRKAEMITRAIDVKIASSATHPLRVGYVMGTGDTVPEAIEGLGLAPHMLSAPDLLSGDLSAWDVIVVGIRAYSVRPDLFNAQSRLNAYVENGGSLIVQYQGGNFPAPFPLSMGGTPERVVEEATPVKILAPQDPLLSFPNTITSHDFDGWVEERGHSFLDTWDKAYLPLTETADAGQDPQRGGLLVAHPGKGTYVYISFALHRQLPELVPGAYRLLANLLSAGQNRIR